MRSDHPHVNLDAELDKFCDHWHDQPGAKGRKVNWVGTYRNWIRREAASRNGSRARARTSTTDALVAQTQALKHQPPPRELLP